MKARNPVVALTVVASEPEAVAVCGMLEANGIRCAYQQTSFGAGTMDGMRGGQQEILVSDEDAKRAWKLLDS